MQIDTTSFGKCLQIIRETEQEFREIRNDSNHMIRSLLYQLLIVLNRYDANIYHVQRDTYVHADSTDSGRCWKK